MEKLLFSNLKHMDFTFINQKQFLKTAQHLMKSNSVLNVILPLLAIHNEGNTKLFSINDQETLGNEYFTSAADLDDANTRMPKVT